MTGFYYHSPFNRMTINFPWDIGYDNNGNMTSWIDSGATMTTEPIGQRGWDRENRLTLVNASAVGANVTYSYDALGRRITRDDGRETRFTYDGQDVLMDDDGTKYQNAPGIDNKLKQKKGSTAKYFLQDHLGSTVGLADSSGTITESNSYDSFGNPTNSTFSSRYQFTGREFDSFTGLQYSRARWYHPQIGRFISEDPIGFAGGDVNLYGYVRNNPLMFTDPFGLQDVQPLPYPTPQQQGFVPFKYNFGCPSSGLGIGAFSDFGSNFDDMRRVNFKTADKFFHCMANCRSARRGTLGDGIARAISEGREIFDGMRYPQEDCDADRHANSVGRNGGANCGNCEDVCSQFRPFGMPYPVPPRDPCQTYGNWSCK